MVVRHHAIDFASGALVFPGGRVDENDFALAANPTLCARTRTGSPTARDGVPAGRDPRNLRGMRRAVRCAGPNYTTAR